MNTKRGAPNNSVGQMIRRPLISASIMLTASLFFVPLAKAESADKILKAMTDYVASQKTFAVTFDSTTAAERFTPPMVRTTARSRSA